MSANSHIENFLQFLTAGVLTGVIYGLMCVGLTTIFGIMRVISFALGEFMMLGMYVAYYCAEMAVEHINRAGGIHAPDRRPLELVAFIKPIIAGDSLRENGLRLAGDTHDGHHRRTRAYPADELAFRYPLEPFTHI